MIIAGRCGPGRKMKMRDTHCTWLFLLRSSILLRSRTSASLFLSAIDESTELILAACLLTQPVGDESPLARELGRLWREHAWWWDVQESEREGSPEGGRGAQQCWREPDEGEWRALSVRAEGG